MVKDIPGMKYGEREKYTDKRYKQGAANTLAWNEAIAENERKKMVGMATDEQKIKEELNKSQKFKNLMSRDVGQDARNFGNTYFPTFKNAGAAAGRGAISGAKGIFNGSKKTIGVAAAVGVGAFSFLFSGSEFFAIILSSLIYAVKFSMNFNVSATIYLDIAFFIALFFGSSKEDRQSGMGYWIFALFMSLVPILNTVDIVSRYCYGNFCSGIITFAIYFPWWFFYFAFVKNSQSTTFLKLIHKACMLILIVGISILMFNLIKTSSIEAANIGATPEQEQQALTAWQKVKENLNPVKGWNYLTKTLPDTVRTQYNKQVEFATGGYYEGEVDAKAKEKLGVYIEEIKSADARIYNTQGSTVFWAIVKAQTLNNDNPLNIALSCCVDKEEGKDCSAGKSRLGNTTPKKLSEVYSQAQEEVDCTITDKTIPPTPLEKGRHTITFNADFTFPTMSYLKTYFIDESRKKAMIRDNIDVFNTYKITDKNPTAVYTSGPIMLGLGIGRDLPVGINIEAKEPQQIPLGITIENQWNGIVKSINKIVIFTPKGIELSSCVGASINPGECSDLPSQEGSKTTDECNVKKDDYNIYKINSEDIKLYAEIKKGEFKSVRCTLNIKDIPSAVLLLGNEPITTKYFRVSVDYNYSLEQSSSYEVLTEPGKETTGIGTSTGFIQPYTGASIAFSSGTQVPADDAVTGNIYLKDVYDIAKELNINYNMLLGILGTESSFGVKLNTQGDNLAHGAMQMFPPATKDVYNSLIKKYSELSNYDYYTIYDSIFTLKDRTYIKMQIYAGTLYLIWTENCLKVSGKPYDARTSIQAYHDGCGNINTDGSSNLNTEEALSYVSKVSTNGNIVLT